MDFPEISETPTSHSSIDPATLSKARSLSIDSIKSSLEKKIKDRHISLSTEATAHTLGVEPQKIKKNKKSTDNSLSSLLTFDHVPSSATKREDMFSKKTSPRKSFSEEKSKLQKVPSKLNSACIYFSLFSH